MRVRQAAKHCPAHLNEIFLHHAERASVGMWECGNGEMERGHARPS